MSTSAIKQRQRTLALNRRQLAIEMFLQGKTQAEIAYVFGVDPGTVSRDIQACRAEWLERIAGKYDELVAREIARLDALEWEAMQGYWRSCDPKVVTKKIPNTDANGVEDGTCTEEITVTTQAGNATFLSVALKASQQRGALMGLDDPEAFAARGGSGEVRPGDVQVIEVIVEDRKDVPAVLSYAEFADIRVPETEQAG